MYNNKFNHIKLLDLNYDILKKVWSDEFMKLLQFIKNDLDIVYGREKVFKRLQEIYKPNKANLLYNFYCAIQLNGLADVKKNYSSSTYYRNIKELKKSKVYFGQSYKIQEINFLF